MKMFTKDDLIHAYTRKQALEDGVLIDASEMAKAAGFRHPFALTQAAWAECVAVPDEVRGEQDETGRLWDVLNVLAFAAKVAKGPELRFSLNVRNSDDAPALAALKAVCGPDDDGAPCITVMLEGED